METSTLPVKAYLLGAYENLTLRIILRATLTSKGFEHPTYIMRGERSTDRSTAAVMWQTINQYNKIHVSRSTRFSSLKNKNNISYEKLKQQKPYNAAYKRTMQMCASLTSHCLVFHAVSVITAGNIKQENQPTNQSAHRYCLGGLQMSKYIHYRNTITLAAYICNTISLTVMKWPKYLTCKKGGPQTTFASLLRPPMEI